ncbi:small nucleolar ribonucleoprotein complex [Grosmannia clavigera kw1407]|uniref:Small nucleolar ribonucleoprotein complex n=1 Tax=Grosmannia clavigera (strain kw1407 / UAMH 11150) TaxID=655863 RepID=F0XG58_GROCL|nr:small nucleolar ribonucleoprotein complex [Grosmannia clavigera kw1407]EFX03180.1 small nucleolar ribonucleoprotein complex [Grosmannia clavigera kw1407]
MSSFFTNPGEKKRKRTAAPDIPQKRVAAASKAGGKSGSKVSSSVKKAPASRRKEAPAVQSQQAAKAAKADKSGSGRAGPRDKKNDDDESISGSGSDDDFGGRGADGSEDGLSSDDDSDLEVDEGEGDEAETAAERRLRLAERYLENVRQDVAAVDDTYGFDAEEIDRDLIAERLEEDVAESKGKVYRRLAGELDFEQASHCLLRWNAKNVNAVAVCAPYAYTGSSDTYLTKWRIQDLPDEQQQKREAAAAGKKKGKGKGKGKEKEKEKGEDKQENSRPARKRPERVLYRRGDPRRRRDKEYQGHVGAILAVAASQDGRFVATGGADRRLVVYDAATLKPLRVFTHHRDAVTGLAFRRGTNQLYSCSRDRTIKIWSLDELAYVQTLFGHQDEVAAIDALAQERCISVGTRDRTARMWKVVEETQLVFRGGGSGERPATARASGIDPRSAAHEGSMDCVALLDDELFVTGSDNGALALWSIQKKKPLFVVPRAHGLEPLMTGRELYDRALGGAETEVTETEAAVNGVKNGPTNGPTNGRKTQTASSTANMNPPPPPQPRWITALRTVPYADVVLSGSWDGCVRVWRLSADKRRLEPLGRLAAATTSNNKAGLAAPGVVNDIAVFERGERGRDGLSIVVALGREHRLGRWGHSAGARNGAVVFEVAPLPKQKAIVDEAESR